MSCPSGRSTLRPCRAQRRETGRCHRLPSQRWTCRGPGQASFLKASLSSWIYEREGSIGMQGRANEIARTCWVLCRSKLAARTSQFPDFADGAEDATSSVDVGSSCRAQDRSSVLKIHLRNGTLRIGRKKVKGTIV
eukprot:1964200-Rhodomonas_salina.1